jgi:pyruvate dehydrogenase E2 component (dihydrolipoamide acetyltransferase)
MAQAVIMPKAGMSMETGTILAWIKSPGDAVRRGEPLLVIETDKVSMEVEAETDGVLLAITHRAGDVVPVTRVIGYIGSPGETLPAGDDAPDRPAASGQTAAVRRKPVPVEQAPGRVGVRATPLARSVARQRGLELAGIRGTGPGGAVRLRDLPAAAPARAGARMPTPLTLHAAADVTELERMRSRFIAEGGVDLSVGAFLLKAAAAACRANPILRTRLVQDERTASPEVNMGVAVARSNGLVVPVIRAADTLTLSQLGKRAGFLAQRAHEGSLAPADLTGAVFTVINLGPLGVTMFDPVIGPDQGAALGVGAIQEMPALHDGRLEVRWVLDIALSFDRRVMDEAQAAFALKTVRELLESPLLMLL